MAASTWNSAGRSRRLRAEDIRFEPGVNEELAATAIWGTQQASLLPGRLRDGVFGLWYGKGPGVDRSGDALKHGNLSGVSRHGGVLAVAGDDPAAKSSSLAHQSEPAFIAAGMPVVYPATLQDLVLLGLHAWEMSRVSGCWVGLKVVTELMDSSASIELAAADVAMRAPEAPLADGDYIAWSRPALAMEESLIERRLPMAQAFWRLNRLDRVHNPGGGRIGIAASGRAYLEVREALRRLGVDDDLLGRLGLRIYQVSLAWPLEPDGAAEFALGLRELLVVEEKQPLIEDQFARLLYGHDSRPRLAGKRDGDGRALIPSVGELNADGLVPLLARWLRAVIPDWTPPVTRPAARELTLLAASRQRRVLRGLPAQPVDDRSRRQPGARRHRLPRHGRRHAGAQHPRVLPDGRRGRHLDGHVAVRRGTSTSSRISATAPSTTPASWPSAPPSRPA